jgi:hypothetical protein
MQLFANVNLVLSHEGQIVHRERGHNRVVLAGEELVAKRVDPTESAAAPNYVALGSDNTPVASTDTGLGSEESGSRTLYTDVVTTASRVAFTFDITATAPWTVNEVGLFNDVAAGTMLARFLTQGFSMALNDELAIAWTLVFKGWNDIV